MSEIKEKRKMISAPEAKAILEKIDLEKADQIQRRTHEYLLKFSKIEPEEAVKIRNRLVEEAGLSPHEAVELTNIMPKSLEELRVFTSGWKKLIPTETAEKILKILSGSGKG